MSSPAAGVIAKKLLDEDELTFPQPAIVRKQVRFWHQIFYQFPSSTVIVHETTDPERVVDNIDYRTTAIARHDEPVPRKEREEVTNRYLKRYTKAVEHFAHEGAAAVRYGPIEQRLFDIYKVSPEALQRLYKGDVKLRAQTGLADDFLRASATARAYLPVMEKIFERYGVPKRLTRLPFVESMFNLKARSKVGASGIWQFMPQTARYFIYVNKLVDERNSPEKATKAAAQFLQDNYRELGSWPLAIAAYNHGKVGIAHAAKQLGTKDIGTIIESYTSPTFGFASRNFYAEFLAAAGDYDRLHLQQRIPKSRDPPDTESVILQHPTSVADLIKHTPLTRQLLSSLNPCLLRAAMGSHFNKSLPAFYEIKVPRSLASAVRVALQTFNARRYAKR